MATFSKGDWERIANSLLESKFYLTALELHTELLENGLENRRLSDFFSNPGNFETTMLPPSGTHDRISRHSSSSSLDVDSLELTRYSDELEGRTDERVVVLEFELRKAHETIKSLRTSLTKASEPNQSGNQPKDNRDGDPIQPLERKVINFLLHEHLLQQGNKMAAITFCEENSDQDFDDWGDVGLNTPKPPGLLQLFRNYRKMTVDQTEYIDQLQKKVNSLTSQILALQRENETLNTKIRNTEKLSLTQLEDPGGALKVVQSQQDFTPSVPSNLVRHSRHRSLDSCTTTQMMEAGSNASAQGDVTFQLQGDGPSQEPSPTPDHTPSGGGVSEKDEDAVTLSGDLEEEEEEGMSQQSAVGVTSARREMSRAFREAVMSLLNGESSEVVSQICSLVEERDVANMLSKAVPALVPHVPNKHRQHLLPLMLWCATNHHDDKTRDHTLQQMFNLIKKPGRMESEALLAAMVTYARINPEERVASELLPLCWEHLADKQLEKRVLVADCCGRITPYLQPALRSSLLVSILSQLLAEERVEVVRRAAVKSLTVVVALIDDSSKFNQCWELLQRALSDRSQLVVSAAAQWLLPSLAAWAYQLDLLDSVVVAYFLEQINVCIKHISRLEGESGATERCVAHLQHLLHLVPWQVAQVLLTTPPDTPPDTPPAHPVDASESVTLPAPLSTLLDLAVIFGSEQALKKKMAEFHRRLPHRDEAWTSLNWFETKCLPSLLKASGTVGFSQPEVVHNLCALMASYAQHFGQTYIDRVLRPLFRSHLQVPAHHSATAVANNRTGLTTPLVPLYACGVLASFVTMETDMQHFIKDTLVTLATCYADLSSVAATVAELSREHRHHSMLVAMLQELSAHPKVLVRQHMGRLLACVSELAEDRIILRKILPVLSNLATDKDVVVREGVIPVVGSIMGRTHSKEVTQQCAQLFQLFVADAALADQHSARTATLHTLTRISTTVDPHFRDEFLIPHVYAVTDHSSLGHNETQRRDIADLLVEAYKEIICCYVAEELMVQYIVPGMQALLAIVQDHAPQHQDTVAAMVKEYEEKVKHLTTATGGTPPTLSRKEYFAKFLSPSKLTKLRKS